MLLGALGLLLTTGCTLLTPAPTTQTAPVEAPTQTASSTAALPPEITADELVNAPVPSLCDHAAGTLSDGELLAEEENLGGVWISGYPDGRWRTMSFRSWRDANGVPFAALVVDCNQGGVGWPPHVVFYTSGPKLLGEVDVSDVVGDGRQSVVALEPAENGVRLSLVNTYQEGDGGCCGTLSVVADFFWDGARARGQMVERITEKPAARDAFAAALKGERDEILRLFNLDGRSEALAFRKSVRVRDPSGWSSRVDCVAAVEDELFDGGDRDYHRVCYFYAKDASLSAILAMKWVDFATWEAAGIRLTRSG